MSDLKIGEAFQDRVFLVETATGNPHLLQNPTCTVVDELGNRAVGVVAEQSDGWYTCSFTPDAAGTWATEWANAGSTIYFGMKIFKVGGGTITDIYGKVDTEVGSLQTAVNTVATYHDKPAQNSADNAYIRDVVGNKTDTTAGNSVVALEKINAAAIAVIDEFHDVPAQNAAANAQMNEVIGNKTDTTAGDSLVALTKIVDGVVDAIKARTDHHLVTRTWFSDTDDSITCNTDSSDLTLPSVVLPNITGTIVHAYAGIKFRMIENTNAATNGLNGAQDVQVKENAAGAYTDAINLADNQWLLAATTREGGDCVIGDIDIVGQVAAFNKTYDFIIDNNDVDQASLVLNDVQTFLIVSYY